MVIAILSLSVLALFIQGCSSSNDSTADSSPTPSPVTVGTPKLFFVSTCNDPNGVYGGLFVGDLDFEKGILSNVRGITGDDSMGLYNDPSYMAVNNSVICTMTQGSMLYYDIRSVDYLTGEMATLTSSEERNNINPVVTDSGEIVYYSEHRETDVHEIRKMNVDGTGDSMIYSLSSRQSEMKISQGLDTDMLVMTLLNNDNTSNIFTFDIDNTVFNQVTEFAGSYPGSANFNSAGQILYIMGDPETGVNDIYRTEIDGSGTVKVTDGEMAYGGPVWQFSRWIVFQSGSDIWMYDTETRINTNLTSGLGGTSYSHSLFTTP